MASSVEKIKSKLDIVDVVGSYLKLEKAGLNYRACCPFHNEKTPSFFVSPSRGSYHCFGCNRGGDLISFVQEIEGLDFIEALKVLAERAGIELEPFKQEQTISNRLYDILAEATNFYIRQLINDKTAWRYLLERGLNVESVKKWRLGFAPDNWRGLADYLASRGYREEEMVRTGLLIPSRGPAAARGYDRFRSRIMFPLSNPGGKIVGFSGRIFSASRQVGATANDVAKYINSPQTELYDKSRLLYGYDQAKMAIRQKDFCVFVEGQMDLILSHQSGLDNTVAVSGTALSSDHARLVKRLTDNVVLAYDYDTAGLAASWRAINLLREEGILVKIAKLPSGQDPADVGRKDPGALVKAVNEAEHYIDFMIGSLQESGKTGLELNLAVNNLVLPYIKALDKKMEQAHFVSKLAYLLKIGEEAIWSDLQKIKIESMAESPKKDLVEEKKVIDHWQLVENRLFGLFFLLQAKGQESEIKKIMEKWITPEVLADKIKNQEPLKNQLALEAELVYDPVSNLLAEGEELARVWQMEKLKSELKQALTAVQEAEKAGQSEVVAKNLQQCQELSSAINKLKK